VHPVPDPLLFFLFFFFLFTAIVTIFGERKFRRTLTNFNRH
jgi:hypothetical protein